MDADEIQISTQSNKKKKNKKSKKSSTHAHNDAIPALATTTSRELGPSIIKGYPKRTPHLLLDTRACSLSPEWLETLKIILKKSVIQYTTLYRH